MAIVQETEDEDWHETNVGRTVDKRVDLKMMYGVSNK